MRFVEPKVFIVAETKLVPQGRDAYLEAIDCAEWTTDASTGAEELIEIMGRLCYNAFIPGKNLNVTKIREGNAVYIQNIVKQMHGSVLEHATISFIFHDVSRVFTHELVRHRAGTAISQESLRYVRLSDLKVWIPNLVLSNKAVIHILKQVWGMCEWGYGAASKILKLDDEKSFTTKKKWTSLLRRMAPIGLATTIGWTVNMRTLRHVLERRTDQHAEEEIRLVFGKVWELVKDRYPAVFADYASTEVDGGTELTTQYPKI